MTDFRHAVSESSQDLLDENLGTKLAMSITPDQAAAHQLLTELRTRISTQPLPYQHGVEARALQSMWEVFDQAREAIKQNPGCEVFSARTTEVLNLSIRPLTAKWHRALDEGRLNGRDGADEFRLELHRVQKTLRAFTSELHQMAYGRPHADALAPDVMTDADLDVFTETLPFGFTSHSPGLSSQAKEIAMDEADAVTDRRKNLNIPTPPNIDAIGLALSGGGIRSATFSLGVVQVLANKGLLKEVDFLSTVSGGGYTGCFLTQRLGDGDASSTVAAPHGPDPEPVRYLRQHARYLLVNNLKQQWSMVTATLAGMLLNWTAPVFVILLLALLANLINSRLVINWLLVLQTFGGLCVVAMVAYGWTIRQRKTKAVQIAGGLLGGLLATTATIGACWALEQIVPSFLANIHENGGKAGGFGAALAVLAASVPGVIRFIPVLKEPNVRKIVLKIALMIAGFLVPLLAIILFYVFRDIAKQEYFVLMVVEIALGIVSVFLINVNLTGPHRLYRDGLARTFIQKTETDTPNVLLKDINPQSTAPYHLINATLNIPSSSDSALVDRGCDFFVFSKKWTGSPAVGYQRTDQWQANNASIDLATAMAVSGAAFSSRMGLGSMPTLVALLTILNVRLGFWIKRPGTSGFGIPGFSCLLREMLGIQMSEKQKWLNLSDGGHIENLAVYELLRRRCKYIICVDGESDPDFTFQGLMTLVRHAQIDFGVRIESNLDEIRPDPTTSNSKSHFRLCPIYYPEGVGLLLYIKLSVTGNESELIKRFRINNPDFPHQTTLDQFFDQEQFEAYRQLGVHAAEGLFNAALMNDLHPETVPAWFRQLARSLLEPVHQ